jgi:hypothetical protein
MIINFKHFLITRFSVKPVNFDNNFQVLNREYTDEWMNKRINLFRNYCLPSVFNQECKNFHWLIYLDRDTKDKYKNEFNQLLERCPIPYEIRYVHGGVLFLEDIKSFILDNTSTNNTHVITTGLDSDDALHKRAILRLQRYTNDLNESVSSNWKIALNLLKGYQLKVVPYNELVWTKVPSNPFVSLLSKIDVGNVDIVYNYFHNDLGSIKTIDIDDDFYWLQTVHDTNILNCIVGWPTFDIKRISEFGFNPNNIQISKKTFLASFYNRIKHSISRRISQQYGNFVRNT